MANTKDSFDKKDNNFKNPKKRKVSFTLVIGFIVLILIAISFVLAPALGALTQQKMAKNGQIVFGKYKDKNIEYSLNSYFYDQVQRLGQNLSKSENPQQQLYQVWQQAFNNTVVYTALKDEIDETNFKVTGSMINKTIINSGVYSKDGKFSKEIYESASDEFKTRLNKSTKKELYLTTTLSDYTNAFSGKKEVEFVDKLANNKKEFEYVEFTKDMYPKAKILEYAKAKQFNFSEREFNFFITPEEDQAKEAEKRILAGENFEDVAKSIKEDIVTNLGYLSQYQIAEITSEEDANKIFGVKTNELAPIVKLSNNTFALIQPLSDTRLLDLNKDENYNKVSAYFFKNESDLVIKYLKGEADKLMKEYKTLELIAKNANLEVKKSNKAALNVSGSALYQGLDGDLAKAISKAKVELFKTEDNTLSKPIQINSTTIVIAKPTNVESDNSLESVYPYYSKSIIQNDLIQTVLNSDKFENNFINVFFSKIMRNNS